MVINVVADEETGLGVKLDYDDIDRVVSIASFKKHPVTLSPLVLEQSGLARLGDEIVAVNDCHLHTLDSFPLVVKVRYLCIKRILSPFSYIAAYL